MRTYYEHPRRPFILSRSQSWQRRVGFSGAELRKVRALHGVGRPPQHG